MTNIMIGDRGLGEGNTPLVQLPRLARRWGLATLTAKAEYQNPTGSYKDRIAAASMDVAVRNGNRGWIATSSGNGGAAMSAYGRRSGLPGVLCVLSDAPIEKLAAIRPYGVLTLAMPTLGPDVMAELGRIAGQQNLLLTITAHAHNPEGMRGADAIGTEIVADHPGVTQVYLPAGGGGLLVATARGLAASGGAAAVVCAQPAGCAPIVGCLDGDLAEPVLSRWATTISGLQLPEPPDGNAAIAAVRDSAGWGVAVSDENAWAAQDLLARDEGIFVEPASAVALAAVQQDAAAGRIGPTDHPCVVLTGHGLKDLSRFTGSEAQREIVRRDQLAGRVEEWLRHTPAVDPCEVTR